MKNKHIVTLLAVAFVMATISQASTTQSAQSRCTLTEASAPSIRGLRLGMSSNQLLALFPGITKKREMKDAIEQAKSASGAEPVFLGFDPATDADAQQFAGVDSVSAGFHMGKVVEFAVQYGGATWRNVDEWIAKLSETLKLPGPQQWGSGPNEVPNKVLRCDGILIEATIQGGGASIRLRNSAYFKEIDDRAKAAEEKKRQTTKP